MAPVYDFRHVELDKIGRGKRIVKPPGGECSDIFGFGVGDHVTPRKTKNYMQSNVFSPDTQERLFGACSPDGLTPRRVVNRQRSSIFEDEVVSPPRTTLVRRSNPITGEPACENGSSTNGTSNGHMNGHLSPESPLNSFRIRNPPGGKSSGIF